jgi:hypothetical protein
VAHSALDNAPLGQSLGDRLAAQIGLREVRVLKPSGYEPLFKIVVWTPPEALEKVGEALWEAGAGHIGHYDRASFRSRGTGTFRPLPGADPYSGHVGHLEEADEWRLEVIVAGRDSERAIDAMLQVHPYEEVAYDVYRCTTPWNLSARRAWANLPNPSLLKRSRKLLKTRSQRRVYVWFPPLKPLCGKLPVCQAAAPVT